MHFTHKIAYQGITEKQNKKQPEWKGLEEGSIAEVDSGRSKVTLNLRSLTPGEDEQDFS